jgi:hypothetical protein
MRQMPASRSAEPDAPLEEGLEEFLRQSSSLMTQHGNMNEVGRRHPHDLHARRREQNNRYEAERIQTLVSKLLRGFKAAGPWDARDFTND